MLNLDSFTVLQEGNVLLSRENNSVLHITEDVHVYTEKRYNALQKFCMKFFFNIEVEDAEG